MPDIPNTDEWCTSQLAAYRREYLDKAPSFEGIVARFASTCVITTAHLEPSENTYRGARQVIFRIAIEQSGLFDEFYNGRDGLRARYWQSPDIGSDATRYLIDILTPSLLAFADDNPPRFVGNTKGAVEMDSAEIAVSLNASSAKVWVRERDDANNSIIPANKDPHLLVRRWAQNETEAGSKGPLWRWTPETGEIEIKGALIDAMSIERIPESKVNRALQIHRFGFT